MHISANLFRLFTALLLLFCAARSVAAPGTVDPSFDVGAFNYATVRAIGLQPDGKVIAAGDFVSARGSFRNRIVRLNANGTPDPTFEPGAGPDGAVYALAIQPNGQIVIGGNFTNINGIARQGVARLNANGSVDTTFAADPQLFPVVRCITLRPDGNIFIGGPFSVANYGRNEGIALLNSNGVWNQGFRPMEYAQSTLSNYFSSDVYAIAMRGHGELLVGGAFGSFDSYLRSDIVAIDSSYGYVDSTYNSTGLSNNYVSTIAVQPDGAAVFGGTFRVLRGWGRNGIARLNLDGTMDTNFVPLLYQQNAHPTVFSVVRQPDGKFIIGGSFYAINNTNRNAVARLNSDSSLDTTFDPGAGADADVYCAVLQPDGNILVGGAFANFDGTPRPGIARLVGDTPVPPRHAADDVDLTFTPATTIYTGSPGALVQQPDGKIIIAGSAPLVTNLPLAGIVRLNRDGSTDQTFDAGAAPNNYISCVAQQADGKIVIGGPFTTVNGIARTRVARLNANGSLDTTFLPGTGPNDYVTSVASQPDGKVLVGGYFTAVNGMPRMHLARLNNDGTVDTSFNIGSGADHFVFCVRVLPTNKILVGGEFKQFNGIQRTWLARLNPDGSVDPNFSAGAGGVWDQSCFYDFAIQPDGRIVAVGDFGLATNGITAHGVVRLMPDGQVDPTFNPGIGTSEIVSHIALQRDGKILVGGQFLYFDYLFYNYLVRLNANGTLDTGFNPYTSGVSCLAVQPDGKLLIGCSSPINYISRPGLARLFGDGPFIISQPISQTNRIGGSASFTVVAGGLGTLSYQWYKNGAPISNNARVVGTTDATLLINHLQFADSGTYTVTVTNADGEVTSDPAVLHVRVPPVARITISPTITFSGNTNLFALTTDNITAALIADGSSSTDDENVPLQFVWTENTDLLGTDAVVTNRFSTGIHNVRLVVSDGDLTGTNEIIFDVIKPSAATAILATWIQTSNLPNGTRHGLTGKLRAISEVFDAGNYRVALYLLKSFQHRLNNEASLDPILAANIVQAIQQIIAALPAVQRPNQSGASPKITSIEGRADGGFVVHFSVYDQQPCVIETTTNLVDWDAFQLFDQPSESDLQFSPPIDGPARFYRVVQP